MYAIRSYYDQPGLVLAAGVFVAGVVQLAVQLPALKSIGMLTMPRWDRARNNFV